MDPIADKLPPQNIEAEQSVLGCLMLDKDAIVQIADIVKPEDFYKNTHRIIYQAMLDLYEKREPIDLLSLSNRLKEKKQLEEIGEHSYLTILVNSVPTSAHVKHYADIVQRKAVLRNLIDAAAQITQLGHEEGEDTEVILDQAEQKIFNISEKSARQEFKPIKPMLNEAFQRLDELHKGDGALRGLSTGFYDLDNRLAGLQKSDLIILAARPSLGKTTLALDIARHTAVHAKVPVGLFSLEMSKDQLVDRMLCSQGSIDLWRYRTGKLKDDDFARVNQAIDVLSQAPIYIDDAATANIMHMRTMARRLQAEHGLGLIIVDYLQLMEGTGESRVQEISGISRSLKALARELNVPVLALSQLSRAVESRSPAIPKLSDLRESGSLEQDSDVVLFIYRKDRDIPNASEKNIADIMISKHRNGPTGKIQLYFDEDTVSFKSLQKTN